MVTSQHPWEGLPADEVPYKVCTNTSYASIHTYIHTHRCLHVHTGIHEHMHAYVLHTSINTYTYNMCKHKYKFISIRTIGDLALTNVGT